MKRFLVLLVIGTIIVSSSSCSFTKKIKDGSMAYELRQYSIAVEMLEEEYHRLSEIQSKARVAFLLGESYREMGEMTEALPWFSKAVESDFGSIALERKADVLKRLERYTEAISVFKLLLQNGQNKSTYQREIAICRLALDWNKKEQKRYVVERALFNSRESDYSPAFRDDQHVFFSSDRNNQTSNQSYTWTGRDYSDIFMYDERSGQVSQLESTINSENNEGTLCFADDGATMYFTRCFTETELDDYCKIMVSHFENNTWTKPMVLSFVEEGVNYGHPFWVEKGSVLFFSSQQASGYGGFDIYFSSLDTVGEWSTPTPLGATINTIGDEKFPVIKNDTLYFSSDGHLGMGGLDVFRSYINKKGVWENPLNMKSPINSGADDFSLIFEPNGDSYLDRGYLTSSRNGVDDIYSFKLAPKIIVEKNKNIPITEESIPGELKLAITVVAEDENGNKNIFPKAKVRINEKNTELNKNALSLTSISEGEHGISVSYPGYFSTVSVVRASLSDIEKGESSFIYQKTIFLKPIIVNKEIVLENILYDFNKSFIREDAKPSLIELSTLLMANPNIIIELSSHTDCRGPDAYNQKLSQMRAEAAVDFIVDLGVDTKRIVAKGYGENLPKSTCDCDSCSEDDHQLNRRTSFKIVSVEEN